MRLVNDAELVPERWLVTYDPITDQRTSTRIDPYEVAFYGDWQAPVRQGRLREPRVWGYQRTGGGITVTGVAAIAESPKHGEAMIARFLLTKLSEEVAT
jgi:hypothetical protein